MVVHWQSIVDVILVCGMGLVFLGALSVSLGGLLIIFSRRNAGHDITFALMFWGIIAAIVGVLIAVLSGVVAIIAFIFSPS